MPTTYRRRPWLTKAPPLTAREREVGRLVALGWEQGDIAARLGITLWTVHYYRRNLCDKIGVNRRLNRSAQVTQYAIAAGWIRPRRSGWPDPET